MSAGVFVVVTKISGCILIHKPARQNSASTVIDTNVSRRERKRSGGATALVFL
jgi:hypothetical protein